MEYKHLKLKPEPRGLGGWLILSQIEHLIRIVIFIYLFFASLSFYNQGDVISMLVIFVSLFIIGWIAWTLKLIYTKDKRFPRIAIIGLWYPVIFIMLLSILGLLTTPLEIDLESSLNVFLGLVYISANSIIWTEYFKYSIRVKNTFHPNPIITPPLENLKGKKRAEYYKLKEELKQKEKKDLIKLLKNIGILFLVIITLVLIKSLLFK